MPQKQKPVPDATTEEFSAIPTSSDDTLQQQNAHSNLSAYQANPPNVNEARHIRTQKNQNSDRQPTESQSAQSLTLVERLRERLTRKALRQLYENELHILRTQSKYQENSRQNPAYKEAALERLGQVVATDERLKRTQELLKIRQRTNSEFWRDKNGTPVLKNPRSRQALID